MFTPHHWANLFQGSSVITVSATDGDPSVSNKVDFKIKDG